MPVLPSWLTDPLWDQFVALLPKRPAVDPAHPLGCHRTRISDRIVFDKLLQLLRFGCSCQAVSDTTCSATTIRNRRNEWIRLGVFARLKQIAHVWQNAFHRLRSAVGSEREACFTGPGGVGVAETGAPPSRGAFGVSGRVVEAG